MATANLSKDPSEQIQFKQLLEEAVRKPGTLMRAYSLFWNYSLGNQILALLQANERGIPLGPIASFNRWKELGRHVKRGEKAITLCMPVTCKRTIKEQGPDGADTDSEVTFKRFVFRRKWFMLAQTDGAEFEPPSIPTWDRARALRTLSVEEIPFESLSGNVQGYARNRQIAINPLAQMPAKTTFHELAHTRPHVRSCARFRSIAAKSEGSRGRSCRFALLGIARNARC
jgi:N-terminal domain of anti-restriction factor ArdC